MELDVQLPRIEPVRATVALAPATVATAEIRLQGVPRGAALLLCEDGGFDARAAELMNAMAEHGYETLAADVASLQLDDSGLLAVVEGLLDLLAERGWQREQIGIVGYGEGGRASLVAAGALYVGAAVSVSPTRRSEAGPVTVVAPWLGMFGEHDPVTPPAAAAELRARLAEAPEFTRVVVYPGAGADFFRGPHDALGHAAEFDSWQRVVEWLNVRVVPRPSPYAELWALRQQQASDQSSDQHRQGSAR